MSPRSTTPPDAGNLTPTAVYGRLLRICAPYWRIFVVAALSMAVFAVTDTGFAFLMSNLIKTLEPKGLSPELQFIKKWLPLAQLLASARRKLIG